jgi:5-methylcytosine-specific restriction endonuclease McrA
MSETKVCTKCGKELPATTEYFYKWAKGKFGVMAECKECWKSHTKKFKNDNKERYKEMDQRYYEANKEQILAHNKQYYEANKEHISEVNKRYVSEHFEETKAYQKEWYLRNKENVAERYKRTSKKRKATQRKYRQEHKGKMNQYKRYRRAKKLSLPISFTNKQWDECKSLFNNRCAYCGKELPLTQDHFIPLSKNGEFTINNIIPACGRCNSSKCNRDFFEWYPKQKTYSKKREKKILNHLKYNEQHIQQLALL